MKLRFLIIIASLGYAQWTYAQDDISNMPGMGNKPHAHDTAKTKAKKDNMESMDMGGNIKMGGMNSSLSLNLPMSRNGSGTAWLPDASPVYGYMVHANKWMIMFHGDVFIRYNKQDITNTGTRGGEKWDAPDMLMAMGQRKVGEKGCFTLMLCSQLTL